MSDFKRVGVLLHPIRTYCRRVLRGITTVGAQARWEWLLVSADLNPLLDTLSHGFLHGVIGHLADQAVLGHVVRAKLPAIDIAPVDHDAERVRVTTDELAVGRLGAAHLLSLGLSNFAFFGTREVHHARLREKGFCESIEAAGMPCHVMVVTPEGEPGGGPEGQRLAEWLQTLPKPVAVMACSDSRALQILALCRKLEIDVPKSIAVLGVDNDDAFCETANPSLSSIALSTQRIGYEAARMLEGLMDGREPRPRQLLIPPAGVVSRRSTDLPAKLDDDVAAAVRYIALHVHEDLGVGDLLGEIPISRTTLEQKFRKVLGRTPAEEIRRAQVEVAKTMLRETDLPMPKIARAAGFSDAKQLGMTFRRETGTTPTAYRRASHL